jgi:hypothetical protein
MQCSRSDVKIDDIEIDAMMSGDCMAAVLVVSSLVLTHGVS